MDLKYPDVTNLVHTFTSMLLFTLSPMLDCYLHAVDNTKIANTHSYIITLYEQCSINMLHSTQYKHVRLLFTDVFQLLSLFKGVFLVGKIHLVFM